MAIKFIFTDVDGVLTDGGVYYDDQRRELKKFNTRDGAGFLTAKAAGIKVIAITGRECPATNRRMDELHAYQVFQNIREKGAFLEKYMADNAIDPAETAYIGDDLIDIPPIKLCGFAACPSDACDEVKELVDYVSEINGGYGAFRDIVKHILKNEGKWESAVNGAFQAGI